jgi:hypothetical protein
VTETGLAAVDRLSAIAKPELSDYIAAVSEYVIEASTLTPANGKKAQIALSAGLGRALRAELQAKLPRINPHAGELDVAGALRRARADVSEPHLLDGLRLAVEINPVNLAVGRALWYVFGDFLAFAVNFHLKFPFAVVGGVLVVPTWEWARVTKAVANASAVSTGWTAEAQDAVAAEVAVESKQVEDIDETGEVVEMSRAPALYKRPTLVLLDRLVRRLQRTRPRETEADPPHLLEGIALVVYDPDSTALDPNVPPPGSGLRWEEFVQTLAEIYDVRFED